MSVEWLPKVAIYGALFVLAGTGVVRRLLDGAADLDAATTRGASARLTGIGVVAAAVLVAALLIRVPLYTASSFGWADALAWERLQVIALESRWGGRWQWQALAGVACLVSAFAAGRWMTGRVALAGSVIAVCLTLPLLGHAAGSMARQALHAAHLAAGAAWIGSLAMLVLLRRRARAAGPHHGPGAQMMGSLIARFSPIALASAAVIAVTGAVAAVLYVAAFEHLSSTAYGRLLVVKLAAVGAIVTCGALNWRRVRAGRLPSMRVMVAEVAAAAVAVVMTSLLTETEHP